MKNNRFVNFIGTLFGYIYIFSSLIVLVLVDIIIKSFESISIVFNGFFIIIFHVFFAFFIPFGILVAINGIFLTGSSYELGIDHISGISIIILLIYFANSEMTLSELAGFDGINKKWNEPWLFKRFLDSDKERELLSKYKKAQKHLYGDGVNKDINIALQLLTEAAEQGDANSQVQLSYLYSGNEGAPAYPYEAFRWAREAANQEEPTGYFNKGLCYQYGEGCEIDYQEAYNSFCRAMELYSNKDDKSNCQYKIGLLYRDEKLEYPSGLNPARKWFKAATDNGHKDAAIELAKLDEMQSEERPLYEQAERYRYGDGVDKDIDLALYFYGQAARQNNINAQITLSYLYAGNEGFPIVGSEAFRWAKAAAVNHNPTGFYNLGLCYSEGLGTEINHQNALDAFIASIDYRHNDFDTAPSEYEIALIYKNGIGASQDYLEAINWFKKAENHGHKDAANEISKIESLLQQQNSDTQQSQTHKLLSCPSCGGNLRVPLPVPKGVARCKKCHTRFTIKEDSHGNLHIALFTSNEESAVKIPKTVSEACAVLDISIEATPDQIKSAYKKMMHQYHPDKVDTLGPKLRELAQQESKCINAAYRLLQKYSKMSS